MSHGHSHAELEGSNRRIGWAVAVNVVLTFAQIAGGIVSGSLSLIADAIHNFSDAAALAIAYAARRIARRPVDDRMTFGYARAEIVAALINYTTLIVIGLYLVYEAAMRFITPEPIEGWLVVWVAVIALVIDTGTAMLVYAQSRTSMNLRAAFLHNISDAMGSVAVIVAGTAVILYDWVWIDPAITLMIAAYILWQAFREIGSSIRILMLGTPDSPTVEAVRKTLSSVEGVAEITHFHLWSLDEKRTSLEAHVIRSRPGDQDARLLADIRRQLRERHDIHHCTIEVRDSGVGDPEAIEI